MKSTVIGIYPTEVAAREAGELLANSGFRIKRSALGDKQGRGLEEHTSGAAGIFMGGIVGVIAGYIIILVTGFTALPVGNGLGSYLPTIIIVGVIGAISGGFIGSILSLEFKESFSSNQTYLNQDQSVISIRCEENDEWKVYQLLQITGARKIQTLIKEDVPQTASLRQLAYAGIKGGTVKRMRKKSMKPLSSSRSLRNVL